MNVGVWRLAPDPEDGAGTVEGDFAGYFELYVPDVELELLLKSSLEKRDSYTSNNRTLVINNYVV